MLRKYLVFISSTLDDLKSERQELIRIVSEMGAIPITMDAFDISCDGDRKIILKAIENCDYFLNITAWKGGALVGKVCALELECTHANKAGIPVLAMILGENVRWKDSKKEKDAPAKKALETFRKKLETYTFDTWTNIADLKHKTLSLLSREMGINPRRGWAPANQVVEPWVANELARVSLENENLRRHIRLEGADVIKKVREQMKDVLKVLASNHVSLSFYYVGSEKWENPQDFRYIRLFRLLAPELIIPKTGLEISHFLGNILNPDLSKTVRKDFSTPSNTIKKIMADFTLLKLVKCTWAGENETWSITEFGNEAFAAFRLKQMRKALMKAKA